MDLKAYIRDIPDFPKPGILFKDITPLIGNPRALDAAIGGLAEPFRGDGITQVVAVEARGFIFGAGVARELGAGFVPVRKPGKLPYKTTRVTYDLEYGTDSVEMHEDALTDRDRVLLVDDLLATGGTLGGTISLVEQKGSAIVGVAFVIELTFLNGRSKLDGHRIHSLIQY